MPRRTSASDGLSLVSYARSASEHTVDGGVGVEEAALISVVMVQAIKEQLAGGTSEAEVLRLLDGDSLLMEVSSASVRCALVSYRQEPGPRGDPSGFGDFTLDGAALRGVLAQAETLGVDALWLDRWCYRWTPGEAYDHGDFCRTLSAVLFGVHAVIWLPRAKAHSKGEYGYRLWCTFEASAVRRLGLPVGVAGIGMSDFQKRVMRFGSFTPAFVGDGTLDGLCRLNMAFLFSTVGLVIYLMTHVVYGINDSAYDDEFEEELMTVLPPIAALLVFGMPAFYFIARNSIYGTVRLANNAQRVMRIMRNDTHALRAETWCIKALLADLPWLGAYDRRDVHVIYQLLGRLNLNAQSSSQRKAGRSLGYALAFSAYWGARLQYSEGNGDVKRQTLREWLSEKDLELNVDGDFESVRASRESFKEDSRMQATQSWLDCRDCRAHEFEGQQTTRGTMALADLETFGWTRASGGACALFCPFGAVLTAEPDTSNVWRMGCATPFETPKLDTVVTILFVWRFVRNMLVDVGLFLLWRQGILPTSHFKYLRAISWTFTEMVHFAVFVEVFRKDLIHLGECRAPFPISVWNQSWKTATFAIVVVGGVLTLFVVPYAFMFPKFLSDLESRAFCQSPRELIEVAERHELALLYSWQMLSWSYILGVYIVYLIKHWQRARQADADMPAMLG